MQKSYFHIIEIRMKLACIPKRFLMTITTQLGYTFTSLPMHLIAQKEKIVMTISNWVERRLIGQISWRRFQFHPFVELKILEFQERGSFLQFTDFVHFSVTAVLQLIGAVLLKIDVDHVTAAMQFRISFNFLRFCSNKEEENESLVWIILLT